MKKKMYVFWRLFNYLDCSIKKLIGVYNENIIQMYSQSEKKTSCLLLSFSSIDQNRFLQSERNWKSPRFRRRIWIQKYTSLGKMLSLLFWRLTPKMDRGHKYRTKSVLESRFIQILDIPPWLKNSFKVDLSTEEKFRIAQNGIRKKSW